MINLGRGGYPDIKLDSRAVSIIRFTDIQVKVKHLPLLRFVAQEMRAEERATVRQVSGAWTLGVREGKGVERGKNVGDAGR